MNLPFGKSSLTVDVDGTVLQPRVGHRVSDEPAAVQSAIDHPIGTPPLPEIVRPGERVAIIVNDITRLTRTDLLLPPIVNTLNTAGIPDRDIFVVFALGNHRRQTAEEHRLIVGEAIFERLRVVDHDAFDDSNLVAIGTTRFGNRVEINREVWNADRIILTGEIIYHLIAGYSGGRKSLIPGVAGVRTTTFNHRMIFDPNCRPGLLEGNPAHEDLVEACRMADPDFIVNVVLDPEGGVIRVVAGHWEQAHREGCRTVDQMLRIDVDRPFDLIVASAGGFPVDIDLRQAHKGLENACLALRDGGSIVFYAECPNGAGIQSFEDYVYRYDDEVAMKAALAREFVVGGHKAYWIARLGRKYDVHLVSTLPERFVDRCHFRHVPPDRHQAVVSELLQKMGPDANIAVIPHAGFTLPALQATTQRISA